MTVSIPKTNQNVLKWLIPATWFLCTASISMYAQDISNRNKALNFPSKNYGLSIGNSSEFNGLRINFIDRHVKTINGLNVCFSGKNNEDAVINGLSLGVVVTKGKMKYLNMGILGVGAAHKLSGLTLAGGVIGTSGENIGISISGIMTISNKISGVGISGVGIGTRSAQGIILSSLVINSDNEINGIAASGIFIRSKDKIRGVAITMGYLQSQDINGLAISGCSFSNEMHGVTVSIFNKTRRLHGVQLGLLNYAKNNPKGLRLLPIINVHP